LDPLVVASCGIDRGSIFFIDGAVDQGLRSATIGAVQPLWTARDAAVAVHLNSVRAVDSVAGEKLTRK
jgi:hypothetical protein